jgi:hypothetical protein
VAVQIYELATAAILQIGGRDIACPVLENQLDEIETERTDV